MECISDWFSDFWDELGTEVKKSTKFWNILAIIGILTTLPIFGLNVFAIIQVVLFGLSLMILFIGDDFPSGKDVAHFFFVGVVALPLAIAIIAGLIFGVGSIVVKINGWFDKEKPEKQEMFSKDLPTIEEIKNKFKYNG